MSQLAHAHHGRRAGLAVAKPEGVQLRNEVSQPVTVVSEQHVIAQQNGTDKEKLMVTHVQFLLCGSTAVVALTAAVVPLCTNMTCRLTLHRVVGAIHIQGNTNFGTLSGGSVVNLDWLRVCRPALEGE